MIYPEININELIAKLDSADFYKEYGNPVRCKIFNTDRILLAFDLYERLFGEVDIDKEQTIEMDGCVPRGVSGVGRTKYDGERNRK